MINVVSKAGKRREARAINRQIDQLAGGMKRKLVSEIAATGRAAVSGDLDSAISAHARRLKPLLETWIKRSAHAMVDRARTWMKYSHPEYQTKADGEDAVQQRMNAYIKKRTAKKVTEISETTRKRIQTAIRQGSEAGESEREIADRIIEKTSGRIASARAETIARTEMHQASMTAQVAFYEEEAAAVGVELEKEWVAAEDDRTRESHMEADGQRVAMDEKFSVGDSELEFPGDPNGPPEEVINCRCTVAFHEARRK